MEEWLNLQFNEGFVETAYDTWKQQFGAIPPDGAAWVIKYDCVNLKRVHWTPSKLLTIFFNPLFHFVACYLDRRGASIYIALKIGCVHYLDVTDTAGKMQMEAE